jgi:hypothetical protein
MSEDDSDQSLQLSDGFLVNLLERLDFVGDQVNDVLEKVEVVVVAVGYLQLLRVVQSRLGQIFVLCIVKVHHLTEFTLFVPGVLIVVANGRWFVLGDGHARLRKVNGLSGRLLRHGSHRRLLRLRKSIVEGAFVRPDLLDLLPAPDGFIDFLGALAHVDSQSVQVLLIDDVDDRFFQTILVVDEDGEVFVDVVEVVPVGEGLAPGEALSH